MSWTKDDILPSRDASGAPLALRGCDLDFLADAVRARGGAFAEAADAAGGPLSAARLYELLLAVGRLHKYADSDGSMILSARGWVDGDYEPVRADGTAISPAPPFVSDWAVQDEVSIPFALSADALRRAFYDVRRMRTSVWLDPVCDFSGLVVERDGDDASGTPTPSGVLYDYLAKPSASGVRSTRDRVTGGALSVMLGRVRDGAVKVCLRVSSSGFPTLQSEERFVAVLDGMASGGVVTVPGASLRALADDVVALRGFSEGFVPDGYMLSSFVVSLGATDDEGEALAPCAAVVQRVGSDTDISGISWGWRPGAEEAT